MMRNPSISSGGGGGGGVGSQRRRRRPMPSAEELVRHYETQQGMDSEQASLKVIQDLQKALLVLTNNKATTSSVVEMKLDSKPGYPQMFAIGVASSAAHRALETLFFRNHNHVASAFSNIWNAVRSATNPN